MAKSEEHTTRIPLGLKSTIIIENTKDLVSPKSLIICPSNKMIFGYLMETLKSSQLLGHTGAKEDSKPKHWQTVYVGRK